MPLAGGAFSKMGLPPWSPHPPLLLSSSFPRLLAQLGALQELYLPVAAVFDGPTPLPADWAALKQLRYLDADRVGFTGGLPAAWAQQGALPALRNL